MSGVLILIKLIPLFSGFIVGMIKANNESKARLQELLFRRLGQEEKSRRRAGKLKDKKVAWTRRVLALMFAGTFLGLISVIVIAGVFNPELVINVPTKGVTHSIFSFIGLGSPKVAQEYIQLQGAVLVLPLLETLILITESIIGFYFGQRKA